MKSFYRIVLLLIILLIPLIMTPSSKVSAENECSSFLPDGKGGFYELSRSDKSYRLYYIDQNGDKTPSYSGSYRITGFSVSGETIFLISEKMNSQPVFVCEGTHRQTVVFLSDITIRDSLIARSERNNICAVDKNDPSAVIIFDSKGSQKKKVNTDFEIDNLFTADGTLYASGHGRAVAVETGTLLRSKVPEGCFILNGEYCSAEDGIVWRFSEGGFSLIGRYSGSLCCTARGEIFSSHGSVTELLHIDGKASASCDNVFITEKMFASSNTAAYISNGKLGIVNRSLMKKPPEKPESKHEASQDSYSRKETEDPVISEATSQASKTDPSSSGISESSLISETVSETPGPASSGVFSRTYDMENRFLYIPTGTTAAKLISDISFDGFSYKFYDHSGKEMTSGKLGTGCRLVFSGDNNKAEYTIIVRGDLTGEGNCNSRDESFIADIILGKSVDRAVKLAADMDNNGIIDADDIVLLAKLADGGIAPSSSGGGLKMSLTADNDISADKAFSVTAELSPGNNVGAAVLELVFDSSRLDLASVRSPQGQSGDLIRYSSSDDTVKLVFLNFHADSSPVSFVFRFEPIVRGSQSYSFRAMLLSSADSYGANKTLPDPVKLDIVSKNKTSSENKSSGSGNSSENKKSDSTDKKNTGSEKKDENSREFFDVSEVNTDSREGNEDTEPDSSSLQEYSAFPAEPEDHSARYLLASGVLLLVLAAAAAGYKLAGRKK